MSGIEAEHPEVKGLRPYQWQGVSFLLSRDAALLADEMGLGKTVQVAVALSIASQALRRILVVVPASLRRNWQFELARWAPEVVVRRLVGTAEDRLATYQLPIRLLIASYEQVRADARFLPQSLEFDLVVLDEAQRIRNASADLSFACRLVRRKRAWALTGTPLENRPADLTAIFRFLKPGVLSDGMSRREVHARMKPYFLRRRKREVLPDLPPILIQDLPIDLGDVQREAYDRVWLARHELSRTPSGELTTANMLALVTRLKQLCNVDPDSGESSKLEALNLVLESLGTEKVLVFSQYVQTLMWLSEQLTIPNAVFHGGLSDEQRATTIERFRSGSGPRALLISLMAGGVGLNLQEASTVVLFDRWWNPAAEAQALHRAHRFGRQSPLEVVRFRVVDSVEDRIEEILAEKTLLFDEYVEDATSAEVPQLGRSELLRILRLGGDGDSG